MDLQAMRASFKRRAHGLADALADSEIDAYLNHAYQFTIPDRVPGQLFDGTWELTTTPLVDEYAFPDYVHSVKQGIRIGSDWLDQHDRDIDFWNVYDETSTQTGQPQGVLVYGRQLTFRPTPVATQTVTISARLYPNASGALLALTTSGIVWFTHANATIWLGLVEFAEDFDFVDLEARAEAKSGRALQEMTARELNRVRRRRPRSTF